MMVLLNDHYVPDPVLRALVLEAGAIIIPIFLGPVASVLDWMEGTESLDHLKD